MWSTDPQLQFDHDRLQRELTVRQTVYTTLRQGLEQMRIEARRDTPTITVVQEALPPLAPDNKLLVIKVLLGFVLGSMFGVGFGVVRDFFSRSRTEGGNS